MNLSERQERILKVLVEDYVYSGRPIGSSTLLNHSVLNVSSATIRHELAILEDLGLVLQLHTSGGRVPTTPGYRYYVEHLLPTPALSGDDQITIRHQFHQAQAEPAQWMRLAAAVLSHRAHTVALVTSPHVEGPRFKRVELIEAQPHTVLVVVLLTDGGLIQELMSSDLRLSQEELRGHADTLNEVLAGASDVADIERQVNKLPEGLRPFAATVVGILKRADDRRLEIYHQGLGEMLGRSEYSSTGWPNLATGERLRRVVDFLQSGLAMEDLLSLMALESGVQVVIGGESPLQELEDYAIVMGRYGAPTEGRGVLGVLGPTRMDYGQAISLVRYITELMTDLVFGARHE